VAKTTPQRRIFPHFHDYCESSVKSTTNSERLKMFNFKFPWTKRREARKAAEQKARASVIESPRRAGLASVPHDGYIAQDGVLIGSAESAAPPVSGLPTWQGHGLAGGGTFDGGGASGDWSGSSCSSSSSDSSSGSSDSGSSCSSD
jgi:hypothetical protein